jgi:hypothetical protein
MTAKSIILSAMQFANFADLYRFLRADPMRRLLSSGQVETIADVIDANLPASVMLEQRSPKGTTYIHINDVFFGSVNHTGRYVAPPGKGSLGAPITRRNQPNR